LCAVFIVRVMALGFVPICAAYTGAGMGVCVTRPYSRKLPGDLESESVIS